MAFSFHNVSLLKIMQAKKNVKRCLAYYISLTSALLLSPKNKNQFLKNQKWHLVCIKSVFWTLCEPKNWKHWLSYYITLCSAPRLSRKEKINFLKFPADQSFEHYLCEPKKKEKYCWAYYVTLSIAPHLSPEKKNSFCCSNQKWHLISTKPVFWTLCERKNKSKRLY